MFLLVGPSGSGKSTWTRERFNPATDAVISYDDLKMTWFKQQQSPSAELLSDEVAFYDAAWAYANENESEFQKFANGMINTLLDRVKHANGTVFIDTVNASKKKRGKFIELAKQKKFRVVAVEFWNSAQTLIDRQKTRGDKAVPYKSVMQQINAINGVWAGFEADEVWVKVGK